MSQYHFQAPPLTKTNKILLIATGISFLAFSIFKAVGALNLISILGLSPAGLSSGLIYQLITYPLVENNLMSFLFNGLIIWFIGSELESQWGGRVYFRFLLINVLGVGIIYSLVNFLFLAGLSHSSVLHGLSGINFAMLMAYAILYPDRQMSMMMIFPMKARTFCLILAGIETYMAIFSNFAASWAHLLAMGISYLIIRFQTKPLVRKALSASFESKKRSKTHLYVVKEEDQKPPKYWQ
jgi:membrane associated rhomboid family serine protease